MAMYTFGILIFLVLVGCDVLTKETEVCYPDSGNLQKFSDELVREDISFRKADRPGCVVVADLDENSHRRIRERVFGTPPPEGLHIGWPIVAYGLVDGQKFELDENGRVLKRLKEENIDTKIVTYFGDEYLVWSEKDDAKVRKILNNQ